MKFLMLSLFLALSCSAKERPYVVLVSIDGYRFDYNEIHRPQFLNQFQKQGLSAKSLIPVYPSLTFPNHYSLITGLYAQKHGILANDFLSRQEQDVFSLAQVRGLSEGKWYLGKPLWALAKESGVKSASFFWVGSDANSPMVNPDYFKPYDSSVSNLERVDQTIKWLQLPAAERPHLITLYFSDVDHAGHNHGPRSKETKEAVLQMDQELKDLWEKLQKLPLDINLVIVSDHGMADVSEGKQICLNNLLPKKKKMKVRNGISMGFLYGENLDNHDSLLSKLNSQQELIAYPYSQIPDRYHLKNEDRTGDILIEVKAPHLLLYGNCKRRLSVRGMHGYDPQKTMSMHGIFYAQGPQFKSGVMESFENIHLFPALAKILELNEVEIDGKLEVLNPYLK